VGLDENEIEKRKVDTGDDLLARVLDTAAAQRNVKINSDEKHASFAHEFQSELRLTVGLSKICCDQ
jgi:methionyl-tRNA formyltransferase